MHKIIMFIDIGPAESVSFLILFIKGRGERGFSAMFSNFTPHLSSLLLIN